MLGMNMTLEIMLMVLVLLMMTTTTTTMMMMTMMMVTTMMMMMMIGTLMGLLSGIFALVRRGLEKVGGRRVCGKPNPIQI